MPASLSARIALVTGASRGIGAAVAVRLAKEGAHVIACARDVKGLESTDDAIRAAGASATLVPLDLAKLDMIEILAAQVAQRFGRLDVLVGNAAMLTDLTPLPHITPEDWQHCLHVNLTANWQLIRCFDGMLQQSDAGRALFVTSGVTRRAAPYWGAYAVSKAALEAMVKLYAAEHKNGRIRANLIDPGAVRTRMRAKAYPGEDDALLPPPESVTDVFVQLASPDCLHSGEVFFAKK